MNKSILPLLLLAAALVTTTAFADDGFNFIGGNNYPAAAEAKIPSKAPREANPFSDGHPVGKAAAAGFGLALLGPIGAIGVPIATIMVAGNNVDHLVELNAWYSGTVVRGKVTRIFEKVDYVGWTKSWGLDLDTAPASSQFREKFVVLELNIGGPSASDRYVMAKKDAGYEKGDIVDAETVAGSYAFQPRVNKAVKLDFNRQIPRIIGTYCKHDNQACQNDYDSSVGVLYRHQDTEFPPSQYLIDPAILAADQAKNRKTEEDTKAAKNRGGFSFL